MLRGAASQPRAAGASVICSIGRVAVNQVRRAAAPERRSLLRLDVLVRRAQCATLLVRRAQCAALSAPGSVNQPRHASTGLAARSRPLFR
jgi:hypothetical protein